MAVENKDSDGTERIKQEHIRRVAICVNLQIQAKRMFGRLVHRLNFSAVTLLDV